MLLVRHPPAKQFQNSLAKKNLKTLQVVKLKRSSTSVSQCKVCSNLGSKIPESSVLANAWRMSFFFKQQSMRTWVYESFVGLWGLWLTLRMHRDDNPLFPRCGSQKYLVPEGWCEDPSNQHDMSTESGFAFFLEWQGPVGPIVSYSSKGKHGTGTMPAFMHRPKKEECPHDGAHPCDVPFHWRHLKNNQINSLLCSEGTACLTRSEW